jgi:hypothetical protein
MHGKIATGGKKALSDSRAHVAEPDQADGRTGVAPVTHCSVSINEGVWKSQAL